uniref:SPRY domain-containing protein n=1 Tax=Meloidogyne hapla TaxID=6305 RepID=A0A1I8BFZ1_MELHA
MIASLEKKNRELTVGLEKLNKLNNKQVSFVHLENKWEEIESSSERNRYIEIIDDENIKYIKGKVDEDVSAENSFNEPEEYSISLYYFEVKSKIEGENNLMVIGLKNCNNNYIRYNAAEVKIKNGFQHYRLSTFSWNNNDTFGCGLVYPPTKTNGLPYVFFTQNGKQIGKATLSKDNCDIYQPYVVLKNCSVEANFGNNLEDKPFCYDISKHFLINEFY